MRTSYLVFALCLACFENSLAEVTSEDEGISAKSTEQLFKERKKEEREVKDMPFSFSAHKPFYILPYTYNSTPSKGSLPGLDGVDHAEAKFQFSFKFNVVDAFWKEHLLLAFAYTNLSYWQVYNSKNSAPFRETNHEPEMFLEYHPVNVNSTIEASFYRLGFVHQSNGQDVPESRSWNRFYLQGIFNFKYFASQLKVWGRVSEDPKNSPLAAGGDDNPDIAQYMGDF